MSIAVACGTCSSKLKAPDAAAGKTLKCPKCAASITVPGGKPASVTASSGHDTFRRSLPRNPASQVLPKASPPVVAKTTECPFCGETILATAKKCKHCRQMLDGSSSAAEGRGDVVTHVQVNQASTVIVQGSPKSVVLAVVLALLFGPLGMLYSTVTGAIIMFVANLLIAPLIMCAGIGLVLLMVTWPICIIWAAIAASSHNQKLVRRY